MITNTEELKNFIIFLLDEKKADEIAIFQPKYNKIANYLILANGRSTKNISAIADFIAHELKHKTSFKVTIEGLDGSEWVLIDTGEIIVHLFHPEARKHYNLEEIWQKS